MSAGNADVRFRWTESALAWACRLNCASAFHFSIRMRPRSSVACEAAACSLSKSGNTEAIEAMPPDGAFTLAGAPGLFAGVCPNAVAPARKRYSTHNLMFIFCSWEGESQTTVADEAQGISRFSQT